MAFKKIPDDLIPMRAGIVRVTELDAAGRVLYDTAITTKRNFLQSSQHSVSRTTETVANGNGQDAERVIEEIHTLAVATNVYDPKFHSALADTKKVETPEAVLMDVTIVPESSGGTYTFTKDFPVKNDDEKYHFEIRTAQGDLLTQTEESATGDQYVYEDSGHTLTFAAEYKGQELTCVYYAAGTDGEGYQANPILKNKTFQIEVMGEVQSISTGEMVRYYAKIARAGVSGDLPDVTTQKPLTNTITYNFKSMPVPAGMSPFYQSFTKIAPDSPAAAAYSMPKAAPVKNKV